MTNTCSPVVKTSTFFLPTWSTTSAHVRLPHMIPKKYTLDRLANWGLLRFHCSCSTPSRIVKNTYMNPSMKSISITTPMFLYCAGPIFTFCSKISSKVIILLLFCYYLINAVMRSPWPPRSSAPSLHRSGGPGTRCSSRIAILSTPTTPSRTSPPTTYVLTNCYALIEVCILS